ncbi:MAG TPA: pyridoxal-dependent decarboxylase, partial [Sphingomonadales bacterium]|nr:pyridoxal-dependent decarboxylase [Sphingomonadales bacterium]
MTRLRKTKSPARSREMLERTLDPADWESFRGLAHAILDDAIDYVRDVRKRKPWQPLPDSAKGALSAPLPEKGQPLEKVYRDFRRNIMPYPLGNLHPRHWGWVNGSGTPEGMLAEMLAAAMNSNVTGHDQAPVWVELQVINWFKKLFRLPAAAGGLLVSGGSMANLTALLAARTYAAGGFARDKGIGGKGAPKFTVYGSVEAHYCMPRALDVMGLGRGAFRAIRTRADFTVDTEALRFQIAEDRKA